MITVPTYIDVPIFATLGTKVEPDASIFTNGYAVDTIWPTEHLSYFFHGFTSNDITQEDSIDALIVELNSILTAAGITPDPLLTSQILSSLNILYVKAAGGSSIAGTTTITGTLTSSGGTLSGSWAGNPTFSGTPVFSSGGSLAGTFSGSPTLSGNPTFSGTPIFSSGASLTGTFSGNPTLSGNPTFSGTPIFSTGASLTGTFSGNPTFSGTPVFSNEITVAGHNIAPRPITASGIGQLTSMVVTNPTIPAGGTWAWWHTSANYPSSGETSGIVPGGTVINSTGNCGIVCWRIT